MEMLFIASPTRSLLLPVLYLSTHEANRLSSQIYHPTEDSDFEFNSSLVTDLGTVHCLNDRHEDLDRRHHRFRSSQRQSL